MCDVISSIILILKITFKKLYQSFQMQEQGWFYIILQLNKQ
jgi:hypothetical protein